MTYKSPTYGKGFQTFYSGGGYNPLEPPEDSSEYFTGARVPIGRLGSPTSIQTADQIKEVSSRLSEGVKFVEVGTVQPDIFETIPKQQFEDINRLAKLTGSEATLHAPIIDPAGFSGERGKGWDETSRKESERQLMTVLQRAHEMNPDGNANVTIHASANIPSYEWEVDEHGHEKRHGIYVVDQDTGELAGLIKSKIRGLAKIPEPANFHGEIIKVRPMGQTKYGEPGEYEVPAEVALDEHNEREWRQPLTSIEHTKGIAENWYQSAEQKISLFAAKEEFTKKLDENELKQKEEAVTGLKTAHDLIEDQDFNLKEIFNRAYRFDKDDSRRKRLLDYAQKYNKQMNEIKEIKNQIQEKAEKKGISKEKYVNEHPEEFLQVVKKMDSAGAHLIEGLRASNPQRYIPAEDFALEKAKETISNLALKSYNKYGENSPVLSVENVYPNTAFSRGESLKKLLKESRDEFVKKAKKDGMSESEAKEIAKKLIGATWDVGHINMMRKYGWGEDKGMFNKEDFAKALAKETKEVASFVKKVHLTDNFGYNDTHLPPGMGEVPFKEMLRELEKKGFSGPEIVEAGAFVAQKLGMPTPYAMEALGGQLYAGAGMGGGEGPFWNQIRSGYGLPAGYFSGFGEMLPQQNFNTYGTGFAAVPWELGGQMPGKGNKFSGRPME